MTVTANLAAGWVNWDGMIKKVLIYKNLLIQSH